MRLINHSRMRAGYTTALRNDGREWLVVVVKGSFSIPLPGEQWPTLAAKQAPLTETDVFTGEPGFSAPLYENDFAPRKPRCDVLLNGSAYAPDGRPTTRVAVGIRLGAMTKTFDVVGHRHWKSRVLYASPSPPELFAQMPISYNCAFGGIDRAEHDPMKWRYYDTNHAGCGYHEHTAAEHLNGRPLPNTEEHGQSISSPTGNYPPLAFGPLGRAWKQRIGWAGTYDDRWLAQTAPFLPKDFDDRYYQCAPQDQQIDYPVGGEPVDLLNLTPDGRNSFRLPADLRQPVFIALKSGEYQCVNASVDTVLFEPDRRRFMLVWRASLPLWRSLFEVEDVRVGVSHEQLGKQKAHQVRMRSKRRFSSLADIVTLAHRRTSHEDA